MNPNKISNLTPTNHMDSTDANIPAETKLTDLHIELDRNFKSNLNTPLHMHTEFQSSQSNHSNLVESAPMESFENLTPVDFLIGSTGFTFILISIYLVLSVMYSNIFPMPDYIHMRDMQLNEFKRELLVQSGILAAMGTLFLSGLHVLQKVRLSKFDRNS